MNNEKECIEHDGKELIEIVGAPYVDEYGITHNDLLFYESVSGNKILCSLDNELYSNAVVRKDSKAKFYETDEPQTNADSNEDEDVNCEINMK